MCVIFARQDRKKLNHSVINKTLSLSFSSSNKLSKRYQHSIHCSRKTSWEALHWCQMLCWCDRGILLSERKEFAFLLFRYSFTPTLPPHIIPGFISFYAFHINNIKLFCFWYALFLIHTPLKSTPKPICFSSNNRSKKIEEEKNEI